MEDDCHARPLEMSELYKNTCTGDASQPSVWKSTNNKHGWPTELTQRTVGTQQDHKTVKCLSDIKGLFIMTDFVRRANGQDFPLQLAAVKAVLVTATIFSSGWLSQLPMIDSFFIHHTEWFLTNAWKSSMMTVVFVSSLGSTTQFSRTSSLGQHTFVLVMDQEGRHALLSNVQMTNCALNFALCGEVSSNLNRMSDNVLPTPKGHKEKSAKRISAD